MQLTGRLFDAGRSLSRPARLSVTAQGLQIEVDGEAAPRHPTLMHITERLGGLPRKLHFADGSIFEAPPDAPVDGLLPGRGMLLATVARLEASWRWAAAAAVISIALLFVTYRYGLPLAAAAAADLTPQVLSDLMNDGTLQTIDHTLLGPSTLPDARTASVSKLFNSLTAASPSGPHLQLLFRDGGRIGPNALALPGGTIIVTDQLIHMAQSDDEIAGVLAHEIGHVEQRHTLQQIYRALGITALVAVVGGDSSQIVHDVVNHAAALQTLAYAREFEAAADDRSVEIALTTGHDPLAFIDLLDRITAGVPGGTKTSYLSSHPGALDRRAEVLRKAMALGWCKDCPTRKQQ